MERAPHRRGGSTLTLCHGDLCNEAEEECRRDALRHSSPEKGEDSRRPCDSRSSENDEPEPTACEDDEVGEDRNSEIVEDCSLGSRETPAAEPARGPRRHDESHEVASGWPTRDSPSGRTTGEEGEAKYAEHEVEQERDRGIGTTEPDADHDDGERLETLWDRRAGERVIESSGERREKNRSSDAKRARDR